MNESMDRAVADWLREGPESGPREALERTLATTRHTSQRSGWTIPERWIPMHLTMARTPSLRPFLALATVVLLLAALAAAALIAGSPQPLPEPFGLARNGVVAYERDGDLVVAESLASSGRILVGGPTADRWPTFSQQGDRLAFIRTTDAGLMLMVAGADGSDVRPASGPYETHPAIRWSPDGTQLLVEYTARGMPRLDIVAADASAAKPLDVGVPADRASWRPDGRSIAFRGLPGDGTQLAAVYLAEADGADPRRLDIIGSRMSVGDFESLGWSPDGTRLSFESSSADPTMGSQIHIVDVAADGTVLADRPMRFVEDSDNEVVPVWSPDGSRLSFILDRDGIRQVVIASPVPGSAVTPIGPAASVGDGGGEVGLGHAWSPDGRTVVITVHPSIGSPTFWSVDVATGERTELDGPTVEIPSWQRLAP